jgi:hypothetical protein
MQTAAKKQRFIKSPLKEVGPIYTRNVAIPSKIGVNALNGRYGVRRLAATLVKAQANLRSPS